MEAGPRQHLKSHTGAAAVNNYLQFSYETSANVTGTEMHCLQLFLSHDDGFVVLLRDLAGLKAG